MAGVNGELVTGEVQTGTALKTILQLIAAANHRVLVQGFGIAFKGVSNTDAPVWVRVLRQTGGTLSSLTPSKRNSSDDETLQTTGKHTATVEPTPGNVLWSGYVHPQNSHTEWFPFGEELVVPGGGILGLEVTSGVDIKCIGKFSFQE